MLKWDSRRKIIKSLYKRFCIEDFIYDIKTFGRELPIKMNILSGSGVIAESVAFPHSVILASNTDIQ